MLSQNDYTYDASGQRLTNTVSVQPLTGGGVPQTNADGSPYLTQRTETYTYDALNRLATVSYGDGESQSYSFDAMGNRTQRADSVSGTTGYAFDAASRLTGTTGAGAATYASDADGNTLTDGARTNTWDSQDRLTQCHAVDAANANEIHQCVYTYGADGLRRSQSVLNQITGGFQQNGFGGHGTSDQNGGDGGNDITGNTTDYAYDGTMLVREMQANAQGALAPTATYLQGPSGPLYRRDDTQAEGTYTDASGHSQIAGKTRWYVYDGLGSVVGEVDPAGNLTSSGTFDVYGAKRAGGTGAASSRQGFVGALGHVTDAETGLVYMRARYYDPQTGRFISEDPSRNERNWFEYADDNPTNRVDANGKNPTWPLDLTQTAGLMAVIIATALWIWALEPVKAMSIERSEGAGAIEAGLAYMAVILGPAQFSIYLCSLGGLSTYNSAVLGKFSAAMLAHTAEIAVLLGEIGGAFEMTAGDGGMDKVMGMPNQ